MHSQARQAGTTQHRESRHEAGLGRLNGRLKPRKPCQVNPSKRACIRRAWLAPAAAPAAAPSAACRRAASSRRLLSSASWRVCSATSSCRSLMRCTEGGGGEGVRRRRGGICGWLVLAGCTSLPAGARLAFSLLPACAAGPASHTRTACLLQEKTISLQQCLKTDTAQSPLGRAAPGCAAGAGRRPAAAPLGRPQVRRGTRGRTACPGPRSSAGSTAGSSRGRRRSPQGPAGRGRGGRAGWSEVQAKDAELVPAAVVTACGPHQGLPQRA